MNNKKILSIRDLVQIGMFGALTVESVMKWYATEDTINEEMAAENI